MKAARTILAAALIAALAAGTIVEKINPDVHIYTSWWFIALLALVAVAACISIVQAKMWRRPSLLLVHAAVPVILLGGALTTWTGTHGSIVLQPGIPSAAFTDSHDAPRTLPFDITLQQFEVVPYAGTRTPMDFVSRVSINGQEHVISMNNILRHRGFRFYQEDYGPDGSSTLSVAHDPWGIGVTYAGYAMLLLGLLGLLVSPKGRFRSLLRTPALLAALLLVASSLRAAPTTIPRHTADQLGHMHVLYKGRICPVQTLAKDFTTKLTGKATYQGFSSEQVLAGFLFFYPEWADEPMVKIKGAGTWEVDSTQHQVYSHMSINQLSFLEGAGRKPGGEKNVRAAAEKYELVRMLSSGRLLKLFPVADSTGSVNWYGQNDQVPMTIAEDEYLFIRHSIGYWQELVLASDWQALEKVFDKTLAYQEQHAQALPSPTRIGAERLYNTLTTGRWLAMLCITLGLFCFAYVLVQQGRGRRPAKAVRLAALLWVAALTAFLLLIFILRWVAGNHIPMAGGFDSMNLMSIVIGLVALAASLIPSLAHRPTDSQSHSLLPAAMLTMGFCQLVAMMSGSNPPVTNLMPVLNSPLLTLHVAVIMCAYALFFFAMMGGIAGLIMGGEGYRRVVLLLLYPAVTLLAAGIIIGAVWANISWGNYWSWDPKEVWALITFIVYAIPLHPSLLRRPRAFYLYCTLAFLSVVITYFGVNLILGGIHAYN